MSGIDQKRLAQFLGMMGSAHDGEALNAARMAHRLVAQAGLTWEQVLHGGGYTEDFVKEVAAAAYAEGQKAATPPPPPETFPAYAQRILDVFPDSLTDWETTFLMSYADSKRFEPSPKQRLVFMRLGARFGVYPPGWRDIA